MSDYISRADAMGAVQDHFNADGFKGYDDGQKMMDRINALPSAELPKGDLISRADVLKYPIRLDHYDEENGSREFVYGVESVIEYVESLPSSEAESDDLIIKGAKGIQDGLYNITDGKLFKYKANGGTVRTYPIVPSADRPSGEWLECEVSAVDAFDEWQSARCSVCGKYHTTPYMYYFSNYNYCPSCGAFMGKKGGSE